MYAWLSPNLSTLKAVVRKTSVRGARHTSTRLARDGGQRGWAATSTCAKALRQFWFRGIFFQLHSKIIVDNDVSMFPKENDIPWRIFLKNIVFKDDVGLNSRSGHRVGHLFSQRYLGSTQSPTLGSGPLVALCRLGVHCDMEGQADTLACLWPADPLVQGSASHVRQDATTRQSRR